MQLNAFFSVKSLLKKKPMLTLLVIFFSYIFIAAFAIKVIEGPLWYVEESPRFNFTSMENCIWYIIVTMTTC